jgi:hypothetical protein
VVSSLPPSTRPASSGGAGREVTAVAELTDAELDQLIKAIGLRAPAPVYRVAGLDVSLTSTGVATLGGTTTVPTTGRRADALTARHARLAHITREVLREVGDVDLAVVEGPVSYQQPGGSTWDRGGLWWRIVGGLLDRGVPVAVMSPTARAKYATGNGGSRKNAVVGEVRRRYGAVCPTDDEADALVLRAAGLDWLGQPPAAVPAGHRAALAGVAWPDRDAVHARAVLRGAP